MTQLDAAFLDPFIAATLRTLKVQCNTEAAIETMGGAGTVPRIPVVIAGVIGITGRTYQGAMSLSFTREAFLHLMGQMLQEELTDITPELADGAAELSNIIFGHAKLALNASGHDIRMALPSVLKADELSSGAPMNTDATAILLRTPAGPLVIEFAGRSIDEDRKAAEAPKSGQGMPRLDAHVLMSFVNGFRQTFRVQCGVEAVALTPFLKTAENIYPFELGSVMGITGAAFGGTIAICFQKQVFLSVLERMLGEKVQEISAEYEDAATEIMNIAFGVAKQVLNSEGYALRMAIPTVVRGKAVESLYPGRRPPIVLPFRLFEGIFWVEFALTES